MRAIVIAFFLMCMVIPAIAASHNSKSSAESACDRTAHSHQYSDIRMAVIEISNVSQCELNFANLEENTVGPDNSFHFAQGFEVVRIEQKDKKTSSFVKTDLSAKAIRKGMRGIAVYCSVCKAIFSLKPYGGPDDGVVTIGQ